MRESAMTRIYAQSVERELPHALLLKILDREAWIPRSVMISVNYNRAIFDIESWFARLCLGIKNIKEAQPDDVLKLASVMTFPDIKTLIDTSKSRPHQADAFNKVKDNKAFSLTMMCRSGKTKVCIDVACNHLKNGTIERVLWLCPVSVIATAKWQWGLFNQSEKINDETLLIFGIETLSSCRREKLDRLIKFASSAPTMIVIDESHMIKTPIAKRSKRIERLSRLCVVRGIMSGTPITRDIRDLFWQYFVLDPRILGYKNSYQFERAHIEYSTKYPGIVAKTKNEDFIKDSVAPFTFEYFKEDDTKDTKITRCVPMSDEQYEWYRYIKYSVLNRIAKCDARPIDIYLLFTSLASVLSGFISARVLKKIGIEAEKDIILYQPKIDEFLKLRAESDEKIIVWCSRRIEADVLSRHLPESYLVNGDVAPSERHEVIQKFRQSACGTLVAMTGCAKRGIDIFEANTAVFYGQSFDFESRYQAMARIKAPCLKNEACYYVDLVYANSLDERILKSHERKENIIKSFIRLLETDKDRAIEEMYQL